MSDSLGARWKKASAWFSARPQREKMILAVASLAVVWALSDALLLTPSMAALKAQQVAQNQKEGELAQLEAQRVTLQESKRARDAELRREEETARTQLASITSQLSEFDKTLVPAQQMADFLRGLLPAAGVEVVAVRTLPPTPMIVRTPPKEGAVKDAASATVPPANIYRHGIEITLAGNYDGLLAYLTRLEQAPQKVLWGQLELKVESHPQSELKLVLYTLSLDPLWLTV